MSKTLAEKHFLGFNTEADIYSHESQLHKYIWIRVLVLHQFLITVPTITALLAKLVSAVFTTAQEFIWSGRKKAHKLFIKKTEANILGIFIHHFVDAMPLIDTISVIHFKWCQQCKQTLTMTNSLSLCRLFITQYTVWTKACMGCYAYKQQL